MAFSCRATAGIPRADMRASGATSALNGANEYRRVDRESTQQNGRTL